MPNLDRTGPLGNGAKTGKQKGSCNSSENKSELGKRISQFNRGIQILQGTEKTNVAINPNDIVGIKKCRKAHHSN